MKKLSNIAFVLLAFGGLSLLYSCSTDKQTAGFEFMPDMYRSPSYKTYQGSPITADSASAMLPVEGSIPRNYNAFFAYANDTEGYEAAGNELVNPIAYTTENIAQGEALYGNFCVHCHGKEGNGQGTLVKNGKYPTVPSYSGDQLKNLPVGKMYWTITHGKNLMGSHASQLTPEERWKVIMHVQKLQKGGDIAEEVAEDTDNEETVMNNEE